MTTYVALLRGINVGGNNKVPMKALAELFSSLGHRDVVSYIQSGNVVFTTASSSMPALAAALEAGISKSFDVKSAVLLRTKSELESVTKNNPFFTPDADVSKLQVTFLDESPGKSVLDDIEPDACAPDQFVVRKREIYSYCPEGFGRSKLVSYMERRLETKRATTRNWTTVNKLLAMMS
jgi:uncharacterized protein (DUF1697 family)